MVGNIRILNLIIANLTILSTILTILVKETPADQCCLRLEEPAFISQNGSTQYQAVLGGCANCVEHAESIWLMYGYSNLARQLYLSGTVPYT